MASKSKIDPEAALRADRLMQIRRDMQLTLGYGDEQVTGAVKERLDLASALKLQQELCTARVIAGELVGTDELLRLSEAVERLLPPCVAPKMTIEFVRPPRDLAIECAQRDVEEWRSKYLELAKQQRAAVAVPPAGSAEATLRTELAARDRELASLEGRQPSNVVSLVPGNGSCAIDTPLEQRYPLAHLDPVNRW